MVYIDLALAVIYKGSGLVTKDYCFSKSICRLVEEQS